MVKRLAADLPPAPLEKIMGETPRPAPMSFGLQPILQPQRVMLDTEHKIHLEVFLTVDASAMYTYRFQRDDFKVGDRLDLDLAFAYRLTDSIKTFPQYSVFTELNDVYLFNDRVRGENDPNTGSNTLYITPGVRVRFSPSMSLTVAPSFPVIQDLNGDQGKVDYKLAITFSLSF